jgi:hypothetical protein
MVERPTRWLVLQRALDPRVAPRRILLRHPQDKPSNLQDDTALPRLPAYVHFLAIRCRCQRSNVSGVAIVAISRKAARPTRPRSQPSAIVAGETQSPCPKLAPQEPVLFEQIRHRLPLPAVQPASEYTQHHLQRRRVVTRRSLYHGEV